MTIKLFCMSIVLAPFACAMEQEEQKAALLGITKENYHKIYKGKATFDQWKNQTNFEIYCSNYRRMKQNLEGEDLKALQKEFLETCQNRFECSVETRMNFGDVPTLTLEDAEREYCYISACIPKTSFDNISFNNETKTARVYKRRLLNEESGKEKIALLELFEASLDYVRYLHEKNDRFEIGACTLPKDKKKQAGVRYIAAIEALPHVNPCGTTQKGTLAYWWAQLTTHLNNEKNFEDFEHKDFITYFASDALKADWKKAKNWQTIKHLADTREQYRVMSPEDTQNILKNRMWPRSIGRYYYVAADGLLKLEQDPSDEKIFYYQQQIQRLKLEF